MKAVIALRNGTQIHVEGTPEEIARLSRIRAAATNQRRKRRRPIKRLGFKL